VLKKSPEPVLLGGVASVNDQALFAVQQGAPDGFRLGLGRQSEAYPAARFPSATAATQKATLIPLN
jgi:hypothetical protein